MVLQKPMTWLLRSVLILVAFVGIMLPAAQKRASFAAAYNTCIKVLQDMLCNNASTVFYSKAKHHCVPSGCLVCQGNHSLPLQIYDLLHCTDVSEGLDICLTAMALQVCGCAIIFCLANVVKAVLAKRMASHFHREAHFQKMRDAIKKARLRLNHPLTPCSMCNRV